MNLFFLGARGLPGPPGPPIPMPTIVSENAVTTDTIRNGKFE